MPVAVQFDSRPQLDPAHDVLRERAAIPLVVPFAVEGDAVRFAEEVLVAAELKVPVEESPIREIGVRYRCESGWTGQCRFRWGGRNLRGGITRERADAYQSQEWLLHFHDLAPGFGETTAAGYRSTIIGLSYER
jgi:hypothetical protein